MQTLSLYELQRSNLKKLSTLVPSSLSGIPAEDRQAYSLESGLCKAPIAIIVPKEVVLFDARYMSSRVQHVIFAASQERPAICSVIKKENLHLLDKPLVYLLEAAWYEPPTSLNIFNRLNSKSNLVLADLKPATDISRLLELK